MKSESSYIVFWLLGAIVVVVFFAILSYTSKGEVLNRMKGEVQKCEVLGEESMGSLVHATIRSEQGNYIIANLDECSPGMEVNIIVKRGALYFNTVFATE